MSGRIERVIDSSGEEVNAVCQGCPGELKDKPLKGITFITGLRRDGKKWVDGRVINLEPGPFLGVTANCELEVKDSHVEFFGYKGFRVFGKHVVWKAFAQ